MPSREEYQVSPHSLHVPKEHRRMLLAKKLQLKLMADNIKGSDLAKKLGKSPSEVSKWLSGNHNFTLETLFEIEDYLNLNLVNVELPYIHVTNGHVQLTVPTNKSNVSTVNESSAVNHESDSN